MNTVLIAEDEKFIRLGLKTMVQRSGIPVAQILEARDGEEALELLRLHSVDLLITDIRMPKMDGIQLVEQLRTLPHCPMVLAVSGYEDFNYAVAMLRNGVSDYLLKPVERQKLCAVLQKLEAQYQEHQRIATHDRRQFLNALRFLMLEQEAYGPEARETVARYREQFFEGGYVGFCCGACESSLPESVIRLRAEAGCRIFLAPEELAGEVRAAMPPITGESGVHQGLEQLRDCYRESKRRWQRAFFTGKPCLSDGAGAAADAASVTAERLLNLVSLSRSKEILRLLELQGRLVAQGDLSPEAFARLNTEFIRGLCGAYKNLIDPMDDPVRFAQLWDFGSSSRYLEELTRWLSIFCGRVTQEFADYENKQKIRQAVQFIQENFRSPLNMAVVSNEVSMNYSLFSLLFKQYTGTNFVNYLQNLRIEETKRLLTTTDWRVGEICRRAGFSDEKHFMKLFKSVTGLSPTEYRRSLLYRSSSDTE
ncbi:MAG: response regulator [Candidatus Ventricola sp.]